MIATGWLVYAVVYAGFALSTNILALFGWFLLYGFYFGFAEGTEKALVADLAPAERRGFAFGIYNAVTGLGALAASLIFGLVWNCVRHDGGVRPRRRACAAAPRRCSSSCSVSPLMPTSVSYNRSIMRRILVTNDDGYRSEGIIALAEALRPLGAVTIVAPVLEASAIGHALTLRQPAPARTHGRPCVRR